MRFCGFCQNFVRFYGFWDPSDTPPHNDDDPESTSRIHGTGQADRADRVCDVILEYLVSCGQEVEDVIKILVYHAHILEHVRECDKVRWSEDQ